MEERVQVEAGGAPGQGAGLRTSATWETDPPNLLS